MKRTICNKCKGCGSLVDSQDGIPWVDADRKAVRAGEVNPVMCEECKGVGSLPEAEAKPEATGAKA